MSRSSQPDRWIDVNFDSVVGPTHHFGGLGVGNLASREHRGQVARPRAAALQGVEKMRRCVRLGSWQAILPPQRRPLLEMLPRLGFVASQRGESLQRAAAEAPQWLSAIWSASSMWTANAATVSPGCACADGKTHLTIANLSSSFHRSLEAEQTLEHFRAVFQDPSFVIHPPLPSAVSLRDEGAANHMRLTDLHGSRGVDVFVYGSDDAEKSLGKRFLARQSLEASRTVARLHRLDPRSTFYLRQHPDAIDAGAFHNDVVATSHQNVWLHHQDAYLDADETITAIEKRFEAVTGEPLNRIVISNSDVPRHDAVRSYLFNSQLLSRENDSCSMTMLCPQQVREVPSTRDQVESLIHQINPLDACEFVELRESMHNGGGPACLRLRVPMTEGQWSNLPEKSRWSESLADQLCETIQRHYPETLEFAELVNGDCIERSVRAVTAVQQVLGFNPRWP